MRVKLHRHHGGDGDHDDEDHDGDRHRHGHPCPVVTHNGDLTSWGFVAERGLASTRLASALH